MGVVVARAPSRGEVFLVDLDPTRGSEIRKSRPCVVVSPDELNHHLRTVVAPMTTGGQPYPFRVTTRVGGKVGHGALDQSQAVDRGRLRKKFGVLPAAALSAALGVLQEMFAF